MGDLVKLEMYMKKKARQFMKSLEKASGQDKLILKEIENYSRIPHQTLNYLKTYQYNKYGAPISAYIYIDDNNDHMKESYKNCLKLLKNKSSN